jgi:3-dehydroquinate dehydratase-2
MRILLLNGPNLDLLGTREPHIYGERSFETTWRNCAKLFPQVTFSYKQSTWKGEFGRCFGAAGTDSDGIIINPAGYSHTSVACAMPSR